MSLQIATVQEIEKQRKRRYDTSDRHTKLIDLYASTYYAMSRLTLLVLLLSLVYTKTDKMYDYLY